MNNKILSIWLLFYQTVKNITLTERTYNYVFSYRCTFLGPLSCSMRKRCTQQTKLKRIPPLYYKCNSNCFILFISWLNAHIWLVFCICINLLVSVDSVLIIKGKNKRLNSCEFSFVSLYLDVCLAHTRTKDGKETERKKKEDRVLGLHQNTYKRSYFLRRELEGNWR